MLSLFNKKNKYFGKKTFTYYIPAPPIRRHGYQEKEFDKITEHLEQLGFEIINLQTQSHSHVDQAGLWVICLLGAPSKAIYETKIDFDYTDLTGEVTNTTIQLDPDIIHDA